MGVSRRGRCGRPGALEGDPVKKTIKVNGQTAVIQKDPAENILWSVAQEDGTRGTITRTGVTLTGPAVLKVSAILLRRRSPFDLFGKRYARTINPDGSITYEYAPEFEGEATDTITFLRDKVSAVGGQAAFAADRFLSELWRTF